MCRERGLVERAVVGSWGLCHQWHTILLGRVSSGPNGVGTSPRMTGRKVQGIEL